MSQKNSDAKEFIVRWNNRHKLDYMFRKKYNIPFMSREHQETNQVAIALDFLEEKMMQEHIKKEKEKKEPKKKSFALFKKFQKALNRGKEKA